MSFLVAKLAEIVLRPSTILVLTAVAGFVLSLSRAPRLGTVLLAASLAAQLLILLLPVEVWALAPLEDRFPPLRTPPDHVTGIVVLGGAVDPAMTEARGMPSLNGAAERMTAFVTLARRYPGAILAFTGGSGRIVNGDLTEADVARELFDDLGLAGRPITYENRSRTTWENAVDLARILRPSPGQTWVLITSAAHMPRAVAAFRDAGWPIIPDPVAYKTAGTLAVELSGTFASRLLLLDQAAHEWLGLAAYRLLGRTRRLLPAPETLASTAPAARP